MDGNNTLRNSVFGGFNKGDVLDFIEGLQQQNALLSGRNKELEAKLEDISALKVQAERSDSEISALREKNDVLAKENEFLIEKRANNELLIEEKDSIISALTCENETLKSQNADILKELETLRDTKDVTEDSLKSTKQIIADLVLEISKLEGKLKVD